MQDGREVFRETVQWLVQREEELLAVQKGYCQDSLKHTSWQDKEVDRELVTGRYRQLQAMIEVLDDLQQRLMARQEDQSDKQKQLNDGQWSDQRWLEKEVKKLLLQWSELLASGQQVLSETASVLRDRQLQWAENEQEGSDAQQASAPIDGSPEAVSVQSELLTPLQVKLASLKRCPLPSDPIRDASRLPLGSAVPRRAEEAHWAVAAMMLEVSHRFAEGLLPRMWAEETLWLTPFDLRDWDHEVPTGEEQGYMARWISWGDHRDIRGISMKERFELRRQAVEDCVRVFNEWLDRIEKNSSKRIRHLAA